MVNKLLVLKKKLLWVMKQDPINEEQKEWIAKGKEELIKINQWLGILGVRLPN